MNQSNVLNPIPCKRCNNLPHHIITNTEWDGTGDDFNILRCCDYRVYERTCNDDLVRKWNALVQFKIKTPFLIGDFVLATKYSDGDPQDGWAVGFYQQMYISSIYADPRFIVVDGNDRPIRQNGFRRMKKISTERGAFIVKNMKEINIGDRSLWWWVRAKMKQI